MIFQKGLESVLKIASDGTVLISGLNWFQTVTPRYHSYYSNYGDTKSYVVHQMSYIVGSQDLFQYPVGLVSYNQTVCETCSACKEEQVHGAI